MGLDHGTRETLEEEARAAYADLVKERQAYEAAGVERLPPSPRRLVVQIPKEVPEPKAKRKSRAQLAGELLQIGQELNGRVLGGKTEDHSMVILMDFHAGVADLERALWETMVRLLSWLHGIEGVQMEWENSNLERLHPESVVPELPYPEGWQRCQIEALPYEGAFLETLRQHEGRFGFSVHNSGTTIIVERVEGSGANPLFTDVQLYNLIAQLAKQMGRTMPIKVGFDPNETAQATAIRKVLAMPLNPTAQDASLEYLGDPIGEFLQELLARADRALQIQGTRLEVDHAGQLIHRAFAESPTLVQDLKRYVFGRGGLTIEAQLVGISDEMMVSGLIDQAGWMVKKLRDESKLGMPYLRWVRQQVSEGVAREEPWPAIRESMKRKLATQGIEFSELELTLLQADVQRFHGAYQTPTPLAGSLGGAVVQWVGLYRRENPGSEQGLSDSALSSVLDRVARPFYDTHRALFRKPSFRAGFYAVFGVREEGEQRVKEQIDACVKAVILKAFGIVDGGADA